MVGTGQRRKSKVTMFHYSFTRMKAALLLDLFVFLWYSGHSANLISFDVTVGLPYISRCQECLLHAGAIHVEEEEVPVNNQNIFTARYWVIGLSEYFLTNFANCYGSEICLILTVKDSKRAIPNEDIGGTHSTPPTTYNSHKNLHVEQQNPLLLADNPAEGSSKVSDYLCLLSNQDFFSYSSLCEICMQKWSDSGKLCKPFFN